MKKILYILAAIVISITGCNKENDDKTFVITGRILKDCSGEPLANFQLEGWLSCQKPFQKCVEVYGATTDADGNFSMPIPNDGLLEITAPNKGATFIRDIPLHENFNINLGTFMASPSTSFVYRIEVNNPYNVGDTLVTDLKGLGIAGRFKFAAPLKDTTFELTNYTVLAPPSFSTIGFIPVEIGHGVFKEDIFVAANWVKKYTLKTFNMANCQQANTQEIVLEIN